MLRAILAFGLTRRPIILLGLLVFIGAGLLAFTRLNIEAYPNPSPVILEITAQAPGLSAEEMERYYTIPIEVGVATTPGVHNIRSTSLYGLSFVRVTFDYGVDYYFAYQQTAISLQQNVSLPNSISPNIQMSSTVGEIFRYQVVGPPHFGLSNLHSVNQWIVIRRLLRVPGVVAVNPWGGTTKEFEVNIDRDKLDAYSITIPQLISAINNANVNVGGRTINVGQQSVNIRGVGLIDDGGNNDLTQGYKVDDLENIVLTQSNGVPVLLKDVAKVHVGYVQRQSKAGRDDEDDIVFGIVVMNRTLHTNDIVPRVKAEVEKLNTDGSLPRGVKIVPFYDRSTLVNVTTHTVLHNLIFGCLLVFFIQWIFLGDLRSAIIVGANIPFALFFAIIILVLTGDSANLLSVGAVDFGIIVDSCVILVENIFRNFQASAVDRRQLWADRLSPAVGGTNWSDRLRLIYLSASEVDKAIFFSAAITIAAFVPLFTMQGVEGQIFAPMAKTYGYALIGALIATFTVSPCLASLLIPEHVRETETFIVRVLRRLYTPVLCWTLAHRVITAAFGVAFLVFAGLLIPRLGTEFLPALEEGNLWIRASMPPTISLEAGMKYATRIRDILRSHPEVVTVVTQHGRPDDGSDASPLSNLEIFAPLKPFDQWPAGMTKEKLIEQIQNEFKSEFIGIDFNFSQYIQDNIEEALSGVKGANSVKIIGPDLSVLERLGTEVLHEMGQVPGVTDLGIFRVLGQPNLNIKVDREKAARYGLNAGDLNTAVQAAMGGTSAGQVLEGDRQFNINVRFKEEHRGDIDSVRNIRVGYSTPGGSNAYIPLRELATITLDTGASYIYHEGSERYIPIKFSVRGRDLGSTIAEAQARVGKDVKLPPGYRVVWAGEFEELQAAQKRLQIIVPISLALIMVLLYCLFNSLRDSLVVLAGIPFAIAGGVIALYLTDLDFSISAAVGFVSLFGVSVMNGILIITYYNEVRLSGVRGVAAMERAAEQRMRPMLMTALSACIGLLPAAISHGIGAQVQRPLATVIVGGMFLGPILLLVVVPALQILLLGKDRDPEPWTPQTGSFEAPEPKQAVHADDN
ncbi:MAG: efflux RND transporter permease subunit [Alphaproteobacteria bacterium]|nr:efflux RND transporter permease subunit [Alphaproteobacteria bacterium]